MSTPIYAENCQVCGGEHLSLELIPLCLGEKHFSRLRACLSCIAQHKGDAIEDYRDAAQMIIEALKKEIP